MLWFGIRGTKDNVQNISQTNRPTTWWQLFKEEEVERIRIRIWCHMCFGLILVICIEITVWKEGGGDIIPYNLICS